MGTSIARIDRKIQRGRGKASKKLGQTYDVRRLTPVTNGSISSNPRVLTAFAARVFKTTSKAVIENETFALQVFVATCDNRKLLVGDLLTETGYEATANDVFTVAQIRPTFETLLVRTEANCSITNPRPHAGQSSQQPSSGSSAMSGYGGTDDASEWVLELVDGFYGFTNTPGATPASVQCGLTPLNRLKDGNDLGTPTDLPRAHYVVYVPNLPGQPLDTYHRIKFPNGDKYEILSFVNSESAGFQGYVCICEKV